MNEQSDLSELEISLERDGFLRDLLYHLSGTLQDIVGLEETSGFISVVGQKMGEEINKEYCSALNVDSLNREQVCAVLVDLKRRIQGEFNIIFEDENKIILQAAVCPFEDKVIGRPSLCMMTSNVFGVIAADNLGYAKVSLEETIANGSSICRVVVYLKDNEESIVAQGNEYFKT